MSWDPESGETFGQHMRGGAPLVARTADVVTSERTWATRDEVTEGRAEDGGRWQRRRDQLGHDVIRETTPDGRERQHVRLNLGLR